MRIDDAYAYFLPQAGLALDRVWWSISDACLERMLGILGFEVKDVTDQFPGGFPDDGIPYDQPD